MRGVQFFSSQLNSKLNASVMQERWAANEEETLWGDGYVNEPTPLPNNESFLLWGSTLCLACCHTRGFLGIAHLVVWGADTRDTESASKGGGL